MNGHGRGQTPGMCNRGGVRLELADSSAAIDLIDELRAHGIEAGLADEPGWVVEASAPLPRVIACLPQRRARSARKGPGRGQAPDVSEGLSLSGGRKGRPPVRA